MKTFKSRFSPIHFTSNSFLENVMPQIKISHKTFPLCGIDPAVSKESNINSTFKTSSEKR